MLVTVSLPAMLSIGASKAAPPPSATASVDRSPEGSLRAALGSCEGDPGYRARLDLDRSGCIDARDVFLFRGGEPADGGVAGGLAEVILVEERSVEVAPGGQVSLRLRLVNNETPLFGYSAAIRAVPLAGATGTVSAVVSQTTFDPPHHLILAAPSAPPLDPVFSVILPWSTGGVFLNANTANGATVVAVPDLNDSLGVVTFAASANASGIFEVRFGPATALASGSGQGVNFSTCLARISVGVPAARTGDLDGDGVVDGVDLAECLSAWGPCPDGPCPADLDCDRDVDGSDLAQLLADWG
jgi:hypothetical protein